MKYLPTRKTQWYDYMEEILCIIKNNSYEEALSEIRVMYQATHPYRICDIYLQKFSTRYVYMLVFIKYLNFTYIETNVDSK